MSDVFMSDDRDPVDELEGYAGSHSGDPDATLRAQVQRKPRYLALSSVVTHLSKAIDDIKAETS